MYTVKQELRVGAALDISSTGDKANFAPGVATIVIRAVAAVILNDIGATGTINFDRRITAGSDTGRVDNVITALSLTTAHTGGKVVYRDGLNVEFKPGEQLMVAADDAAAAGDLVDVLIWYEYRWENPSNTPALVASA